jgi:uncharacterized Rmd1/YagE family protein
MVTAFAASALARNDFLHDQSYEPPIRRKHRMKISTFIPDGRRLTVHALHVGDRINTTNFEGETLSAVPLAVRIRENGIAVLFRYGVAVLIGLSSEDERGFLDRRQTCALRRGDGDGRTDKRDGGSGSSGRTSPCTGNVA